MSVESLDLVDEWYARCIERNICNLGNIIVFGHTFMYSATILR